MLDIPLLIQTPKQDKVSRILVVACEQAIRFARIKKRNNWADDKIYSVMAMQLPQATLIAAADDVIFNNGDITALPAEVNTIHQKYLERCR